MKERPTGVRFGIDGMELFCPGRGEGHAAHWTGRQRRYVVRDASGALGFSHAAAGPWVGCNGSSVEPRVRNTWSDEREPAR